MTEGYTPECAELLPQRSHVIAPPRPPLSLGEAGATLGSYLNSCAYFTSQRVVVKALM
jgi:hypothetical protein